MKESSVLKKDHMNNYKVFGQPTVDYRGFLLNFADG